MNSDTSPAPRERSTHADASGEGQTSKLRIANMQSQLAGPFNLTLQPGECLAITGPSGSGKSLFLRMIADLDPNQGEVSLDGIERRSMPAPAWRRRVVYNAAEPGWWSESVADHFRHGVMEFALAMAPRLGMEPTQLDGPVVQLSTGERQRLALIRALSLESPVLLLDEPTGALDEDSTQRVEAVLRERLATGVTIVMVTHTPQQAARLGQRHLRMQNRQLVPA
jgi:putative ABC transport system ATP-binding protein